MPGRRRAISAHVSVAGGLAKALPRAEAIGAEAIQVFLANPRAWAPPQVDEAADARFRDGCADRGVAVFVHAPYLINFGSPDHVTQARSAAALEFSLRRAAAVGAAAVVMHAGSAVLGHPRAAAFAQVRDRVPRVLDATAGPRLLIEPTAGGGGALASDAASLHDYLDALGRDERVGVCLDTCHLHAAGHDMSDVAAFARALRAYRRAAGPAGIGLVHANDSRDRVGSRRDRHAAIGRGTIGRAAFAALFSSASPASVALIVETAEADHAADIATLKALRDAAR